MGRRLAPMPIRSVRLREWARAASVRVAAWIEGGARGGLDELRKRRARGGAHVSAGTSARAGGLCRQAAA